MKKKRILMVCEAFGGGVFTYVSQLCNDMVNDFDVYLAYSLRPQTPKNYKDFLDSRIKLIEMKHVGVKGLASLKNNIVAIKELRQIEINVKPDIIHLHSSVAGGLGRLAYNVKKKVVVYTPHGYAHILMGGGIKSQIYKLAEKLLGNRAITLTCCESEEEEARKFSKKTAYIETGVNLNDLSETLDGVAPIKNDKFTVYTLGRVCVQKQPQLFNEIAKLVPNARFIWIGNGELEDLLDAKNLEVTGWKNRKEALAMAKGADAFILCSLGEAIAMSLIENMYIKKLILVSDAMGNKSVINDGVNGYVCTTAKQYAKHIKQAMNEFPAELPEKAFEDVLNIYNTKVMTKKYIDFYSKISK
ncbi:TPA: glycosyltransferase [Enterococcus faecium]